MDKIEVLVAATLELPADPAFAALAGHLRDIHGQDVCAILAYGSALRGTAVNDTLLDLYVLTAGFAAVSSHPLGRLACRLVPPNVHYAEFDHQGSVLRAKYAILPLEQFARRMTGRTSNPYFWARFCQPSRLIHVTDDRTRKEIVLALAEALRTFYGHARALTNCSGAEDIFAAGFAATYLTELRPEAANRSRTIVDADPVYYRTAGRLLADIHARPANWALRRFAGKGLSLLRLAKAAVTFRGGVDYAAWKIARYSGQAIEITDWNRRHPVLTGLILLPRLLRKGTLR